jgi:hypothetical protein
MPIPDCDQEWHYIQGDFADNKCSFYLPIAPLTWGLWILDRKRYDSRMIAISLVPVAIAWWTALYLVGA